MKAPTTAIGRGILAGIAGATVLAIWFLIGDVREGEPFRTPLFLAGMIGLDGFLSPALTVALYTIVHYATVILISIGVARGVEFITAAPIMLLGLVLGFLLFDLIFYGSIMVTGINVAAELGWPRVLLGNLLAGVTIFGVLSLTGAIEPLNWRTVMAEHYTIREGLLAGLIGATVVAGWFLLVDALAGRLLFTPAALGSAVFFGTRGVEAVEISAATVLGYTAIHLAAFLLIGLVAAGIVGAAEEQSEAILLGGVLLFVTFEALSIGLVAILASWLVDALQWWNIAAANLLAAASMGAFLLLRHPDLLRDLRDRNLEEDLAHDTVAPGHRAPH